LQSGRIPYRTEELTMKTWGDFERLFKKPGEWEACWCTYYQRQGPLPGSVTGGMTIEQRAAMSRREKKELVEKGCAHGILVYSGRDPVGWCQYGRSEELPRIDAGTNYRKVAPALDRQRLWRITCFFVDGRFRGRGVAKTALQAALASISEQGGGTVEAYPIVSRKASSNPMAAMVRDERDVREGRVRRGRQARDERRADEEGSRRFEKARLRF
jgi:GNAT superfamily N-acetyltransferase